MNTQAQAHGRGLRSHSILGLLGALGALGGPGGPKITAIGPNGKSKDINSEEELDAFLKESIEPESDNEFKVFTETEIERNQCECCKQLSLSAHWELTCPREYPNCIGSIIKER